MERELETAIAVLDRMKGGIANLTYQHARLVAATAEMLRWIDETLPATGKVIPGAETARRIVTEALE